MASTVVKLKKLGSNTWQLVLPNGNSISGKYHGEPYKAREWAVLYCSTWYNWVVDDSDCYEQGETDEKENRVPGKTV